jgi:hypothetical protein
VAADAVHFIPSISSGERGSWPLTRERATAEAHDARAHATDKGFVELMNRTLLDKFFRGAGRATWYLEPGEIRRHLDAFLLSDAKPGAFDLIVRGSLRGQTHDFH